MIPLDRAEDSRGGSRPILGTLQRLSGDVPRWILMSLMVLLLIPLASAGVAQTRSLAAQPSRNQAATNASRDSSSQDSFTRDREVMVESQILERGVRQPRVLEAMRSVPRHLFVPPEYQDQAYQDRPVPIGWGQTISQPYMVALMSELLELKPGDRVLEIGTGSGYLAAVLSRLAKDVYTIEIIDSLGEEAREKLARLRFDNVHVRIGDGYDGWPEEAPFDAIILTAAPPKIPQPLIDQLAVGGRMLVPVGSFFQDLQLITKTEDGLEKRKVAPVRFEPMTGEVQQP